MTWADSEGWNSWKGWGGRYWQRQRPQGSGGSHWKRSGGDRFAGLTEDKLDRILKLLDSPQLKSSKAVAWTCAECGTEHANEACRFCRNPQCKKAKPTGTLPQPEAVPQPPGLEPRPLPASIAKFLKEPDHIDADGDIIIDSSSELSPPSLQPPRRLADLYKAFRSALEVEKDPGKLEATTHLDQLLDPVRCTKPPSAHALMKAQPLVTNRDADLHTAADHDQGARGAAQ